MGWREREGRVGNRKGMKGREGNDVKG